MALIWPFNRLQRRSAERPPDVHISTGSSLWRPRGDYSLTGSEAVFGAVTMLANTVASMHFRLYHQWDEAVDHPLHRLFAYQASPRMNPYEFWQTMEACRDTAGNCYALKVPGMDGHTEALDVLEPSSVTPMTDTETGGLWYCLRPKEGGELYVPARQMLHCRHVTTSGLKGVSPQEVLLDTLRYDDQMKTFSLEQVRGVSGAVVLDFPSDMGNERVNQVINRFLENYRKSHSSLIVLTGGARASSINKSVVDSKVLDVDRITANKVARVYNIPPSLLGDYSTSSYSSQEQQQLEYLERTIVPIARMYEAELTMKLLTYKEVQAGYRFAFDVDDLVVADSETRANLFQVYTRNGIMRVNEARRKLGLKPDPNGETLMVSRDLTPLSQAIRGNGGYTNG